MRFGSLHRAWKSCTKNKNKKQKQIKVTDLPSDRVLPPFLGFVYVGGYRKRRYQNYQERCKKPLSLSKSLPITFRFRVDGRLC